MASSAESDRRMHKQLAEHLASHGLKQTRQREAILDAFVAAKGHVSSEELYEVVRARHPAVGGATVEFENPLIEEEQEKVAAEHGYRLTQHRHILYGLCPKCLRKSGSARPVR